MATVNIQFDTEDKTCNVTINGAVVENVDYLSIYKHYDDDNKASLNMELKPVEMDGMTIRSHVSANKKEETKKISADLAKFFRCG